MEGNEETGTGTQLVGGQHVVIEGGHMTVGNQQLAIQQEEHGNHEGMSGGVENIALQDGDENVVYIVQQEGMEVDGVTYTVMEDDSGAQTFAIQTEEGVDPSTLGLTEEKLLQAISSGQYQIVQSMAGTSEEDQKVTTDIVDRYTVSGASIVTESGATSSLSGADMLTASADHSEVKYLSLPGRDSVNLLNTENVEFVFTCQFCETTVGSLDELKQHVTDNHDASVVEGYDTDMVTVLSSCAHCDKTFSTEAEFQAHLLKHEQENGSIGKTSFTGSGSIKTGQSNRAGTETNFYKCPWCPKMYSAKLKSSLSSHILQAHPGNDPKKSEVIYINQINASEGGQEATILPARSKKVNCNVCGQIFPAKPMLSKHFKEEHPEIKSEDYVVTSDSMAQSRFPCLLCDKVFKWPKSLKSHMIDVHSSDHEDGSSTSSSPRKSQTGSFYGCTFCDLVTRYACSVRLHIKRKHAEMVEGIDVNKMEIRVVHNANPKEVISLDKRPAEVRLRNFAKIFRCPFCSYATQLPSNLTRHLTSKNHKRIFTNEELKQIKVSSFRVNINKSRTSGKLPELRYTKSVKTIVDDKKRILGLPVVEDDLLLDVQDVSYSEIFDDEEQEMTEQHEDDHVGRSDNSTTAEALYSGQEMDTDDQDRRHTDLNDEFESGASNNKVRQEKSDGSVLSEMLLSKSPLKVIRDRPSRSVENTPKEFDSDKSKGTTLIRTPLKTYERKRKVENLIHTEKSPGEAHSESPFKTDEKEQSDRQADISEDLNDGIDKIAEKEADTAQSDQHEQTSVDELADNLQGKATKGKINFTDSANQDKSEEDEQSTELMTLSAGTAKTKKPSNAIESKSASKLKTPIKTIESDTSTILKKSSQSSGIETPTKLNTKLTATEGSSAKVKAIKCVVCPRECEGIKSVLHHMATHDNVTVAFSCKHCKQQFPFFAKFKNHMVSSHANDTENVTPIESVVIEQVANASKKPVTTYDCPYCEVILSSATPLQQHITLDHEKHLNVISLSSSGKKMVSGYNCFYCELSYISVTDLVRHMHIVHPKVERPGSIEEQSNTPARKSSRKRKLPKWLEKDMNVGDDGTPKRRKTETMPVRVSSLTVTELGENQTDVLKPTTVSKVQVISEAAVSPGRKTKRVVVVNTRNLSQEQKIPSDKSQTQSPSAALGKNSTTLKICGRTQETPGKISEANCLKKKELIKSKADTKTAETEKIKTPNAGRKSSAGKKDPVLSTPTEIIQELKCPHCDFTAKRSSALNFHINFNHKNMKSGIVTAPQESPKKLNLSKDDFNQKSPQKRQQNKNHNQNKQEEAINTGFVDFEDAGTLDDDYDQDYVPEKKLSTNESRNVESLDKTSQTRTIQICPYCNWKNFTTAHQMKLHIQTQHKNNQNDKIQKMSNQKNASFTCAYCKQCFESSNDVKEHVQNVHSKTLATETDNLSAVGGLKIQNVYKCPVCPVLSNSVEGILLHVEVRHPLENDISVQDIKSYALDTDAIQIKYTCPYCTFKSKWKSAVSRHVERHHPSAVDFSSSSIALEPEITENLFMCPYCLGQMESVNSVLEHANQYHSSQPLLSWDDVKNVTELDTENLLKCPFCSMHSKYKRCIVRHVKRSHPTKVKDFNSNQLEENQNPGKVYRCCHCSLETKYLSSLMRHLKRSHPDIDGNIDPETMVAQQTIDNSHMEASSHKTSPGKIQTKVPVAIVGNHNLFYRCPICKATDRQEEVIVEHLATHDGPKKYNIEDVIVEMRLTKLDRTVFVCQICKQTLVSLDRLKEHTAILHGRKAVDYKTSTLKRHQEVLNVFKCPCCDFTSQWRRCVLKHIKEMHTEISNPTLGNITSKLIGLKDAEGLDAEFYACPFCDVRCKWKKSVVRHIRTAHPERPVDCTIPTVPLLSIVDQPGSKKGTKILKCKRCKNQTFKNIPQFRKHFVQYHPEHAENCLSLENFEYVYQTLPASAMMGSVREQHKCMICQARYMWKKSLITHIKVQHGDQQEVYMALDRIVDIVVNATEDTENGNQQKENSAITNKQNGTGSERRSLLRAASNKCGLCSAVFPSKWQLRTHYQLKHGQTGRKRIYRTGLSSFKKTCRSCGLGFFTRSGLLTHTLKVHRNRRRSHTCQHCGQSYPGAKSLAHHRILCHCRAQNWYLCKADGCLYSVRFKSLLQAHMWKEHGVKKENMHNLNLRCELCDQKMSSLGELRGHIREHQQNKLPCLYPCAVCGIKLTSASQRDEHIAVAHRGVAEMCDICGESLPNKSKLEIHLKKHEEKKLIPCPVCSVTVRSIDLNNCSHYIKHHPELCTCDCDVCQGVALSVRDQPVYACQLCEKNFCEKLRFQCHYQLEHGSVKAQGKKTRNKTFPCKMCGNEFFTYKTLIVHINQMHNVRNVLRQENQGLERADTMRMESEVTESGENHPTTHVIHIGQGENNQYLPRLGEVSLNAVIKELVVFDAHARHPYKCILCGRSFNRSKYIKLHIRRAHVKDENQPYRCKLCGSGFVRLTEFRKHTRAHSDFRPYKCKVCNKAFKQQANLKEHYYIHSEAKNYQCMLCRKEFKQRGALTSHVVGHDTLKPFQCSFCGKGFTVRGELSKHMKKYDMEASFNETKSFTCHMCMESFPHFPLLLKHIDQHNPEKPFHCQVCPLKFSNFVAMYFHKCDHQHFTNDEITKAMQQAAKKGIVARRQKYERRKPVAAQELDVNQSMQETIYLSQTEDGTMIPNDSSTIEVIIGDLDQHAVVQVEEKQPEHEELLSIAQQLTELSSIAEKGSLLKEEDEIIKNMLDADAEVLANLHKHSSSVDYGSKWEESATGRRKSLVRSYLEQPTPVVSRTHVPDSIPGLENEASNQVLEDGQVQIQIDAPVSQQSVLPTNMEELAHLIAQNSESGEQNNVLAYQNEDGSVIYVCMPDKNRQDGYSENDQIIETEEAAQNIPSDTVIVENDDSFQAVTREPQLEATTQIGNVDIPCENFDIDGTQIVKLETSEPAEYTQMVEENIVQDVTDGVDDIEGEEENAEDESQENMEVEHPSEVQEEIVAGMTEGYEAAARDDEHYETEPVPGPSQDVEHMVEEGTHSEEVVEYQDDETTFIKEELLDVEYQQAMEQNEELMVMYGNFKYTFVKDEKCFTCLHCDTKISNYKNLKGHLQRHLPEKHRPFKCTLCQKRFITKNELKRHIKIHSGEKNHECLYCKKRFVQSGQLAEHVRTHTGEKPFKCSECAATFTTGTQCKQHWLRNHGKNVIPCNQCDELFKTMPDLTRHKGRVHSSLSKPSTRQQTPKAVEGGNHICHICGDGFTERSMLMSHLFEHSMENVSFQCSECDKEFRSKETLNTHQKVKHAGEEHKCTICEEVFTWKKSLQRHVQVRHPSEEDEGKLRTDFTCEDCGKSFATAASLTYHMGSQHVA